MLLAGLSLENTIAIPLWIVFSNPPSLLRISVYNVYYVHVGPPPPPQRFLYDPPWGGCGYFL